MPEETAFRVPPSVFGTAGCHESAPCVDDVPLAFPNERGGRRKVGAGKKQAHKEKNCLVSKFQRSQLYFLMINHLSVTETHLIDHRPGDHMLGVAHTF